MADKRQNEPMPDVLLELTEGYGEILAMLDQSIAMRRIVDEVPELSGVDVAWLGEPDGGDRIVLGHTVNARTPAVNGLVVPHGCGLGGQVLLRRRPLWVSDYRRSDTITHDFNAQAETEGLGAMIAVPVLHEGRLLSVLYGSNRETSALGDRTTQALEQAASRAATAAVTAERARHAAEIAVHEERRRIALELHDTVGAMLFSIGAGIRTLADELPDGDSAHTRLNDLKEQATQAAAALRVSLHALSAPPEQVALGVALRGDCRAFQERTGIIARFITVTEVPSLSPAHIKAFKDVTREALLNVEKHARARSVVVSAFTLSGGVCVTVADDGVGPPPAYGFSGGLGLSAMSERLGRLGGEVHVLRNEDGGVSVQAWIPA
ncbi:GAF domain-containing protein [Streptomyces sp. NA02950]|uniref:GAF domain-containing sensor histidine kinase n=1 Tax=Streptomyces sp. NA02950 TaxID=2742137 RepID=UPI0015923AA1|nr:GAF domain-containing protein [Streptomyces sp. NA02950]QKV96208.1 GAF domain-containing protein [Streptomyces sp. NA02950]